MNRNVLVSLSCLRLIDCPGSQNLLLACNRFIDWDKQSPDSNNTLCIHLLNVVKGLLIKSSMTTASSSLIWKTVKASLEGYEIPGKPQSYQTLEFGVITQKQIVGILKNVFGAQVSGRHGSARRLVFDFAKLDRVVRWVGLTRVF